MNPPLSPPPQRDEEIDCQSTISPEEKKELIRQKIAELDQTLRDSIQLLQIQFEMSCDALNLTLASELAKLPTDTLHMKLVDFQAKFHSDPSNSLKDSIMSDISKIFAQTDPGKT
ncbi:hypothetical protein BLNAU_2513 [Blattamonas nauphoetae]|uniref:Uncharacterized protein n=1 Tax=Blattamonas nauphoetae TaxID=2049346 RepID=A0ABQ9YFY9_9EUKA|nr:hypothetical protein BLNAU_2513 [Blattamonas nauphoetae]